MKPRPNNQAVPSWAIALVVLATAGVTVFAMLQTGYKPVWGEPQNITSSFLPWSNDVDKALGEVMPVAANQYPQYPAAPMPPPTTVLPVAAVTTPATDGINRPPLHGERGLCRNCHTITDAHGRPLPAIRSLSPLPHAYRGLCVNCHALAPDQTPTPRAPAMQFNYPTMNASPNTFLPIPAMPPLSAPAQPAMPSMPATPSMAAMPATPATPTAEGEWLGIEVAPITPLTSKQFKLAQCTSGLVVVEAEAQAATVGIVPGDVLVEINASPINNLTDFFQATDNGTISKGRVQVLRAGQPVVVFLQAATQQPAQPGMGQPAVPAPAQPAPGALGMVPGMPQGMPPGMVAPPVAPGTAPPLRVQL